MLIKGQFARPENHPIDRYWNALTSTFFEISHLIVKIWRAPLFSERQQYNPRALCFLLKEIFILF